MTIATWPTNTREVIEQIIGQIGRNVEFVVIHSTYACPACELDTVTDKSIDSFCTVCSGEYWIDVYSGVTMSAHVTWKFDFDAQFATGGQYLIGDARVKVMHTPEREITVKNAVHVVVDDKIMDIERTTLLGVPINRIICDLKEREDSLHNPDKR